MFYKLPVFALLGCSITLALNVGVLDVINMFFSWYRGPSAHPFIDNEFQVILMFTISIVMGLIYGLIFGILDLENEPLTRINATLLRQQSIAYPLGALIGGVGGALNQYLREHSASYSYDPLKGEDMLDDDVL
jgi:thiamine transporter ThiT